MKQNQLFPLYVVVLNWNLANETIQCIESVQANAYSGVHIILVDNASTDSSVDLFRERFEDSVILIENPQNLGFAGGVNVGIRHALARGARSILLINNDTTIAPTMIEYLASAADQYPKAGLIGPIIYYDTPSDRIWRIGDQHHRWLPIPTRFPDRLLASANHNPFRLDYITACGMLVRRYVFEKIGFLDERYFMYFEDADFCQRATQAGYEIWCAPQAKMWHKVSLSAQKQKAATRYLQSWGRVAFYHSHWRGFTWAAIVIYLLLKGLAMTARDLVASQGAKDHGRELIFPMWAGIFDGLFHRPARWKAFLQHDGQGCS